MFLPIFLEDFKAESTALLARSFVRSVTLLGGIPHSVFNKALTPIPANAPTTVPTGGTIAVPIVAPIAAAPPVRAPSTAVPTTTFFLSPL